MVPREDGLSSSLEIVILSIIVDKDLIYSISYHSMLSHTSLSESASSPTAPTSTAQSGRHRHRQGSRALSRTRRRAGAATGLAVGQAVGQGVQASAYRHVRQRRRADATDQTPPYVWLAATGVCCLLVTLWRPAAPRLLAAAKEHLTVPLAGLTKAQRDAFDAG